MTNEDPIDHAELERRVDQELEQLRIAGRLYQFKSEPRCRVCKHENGGVAKVVNKLLAAGETYTNILEDIRIFNDGLPESEKISYDSIRSHHKKHFHTDDAAAAVYRRILERHASESEVDFVRGVKNAVTPLAYLETVMNKGYQSLVDPRLPISPQTGMEAATKLHELTRDNSDQDLHELIHRTNRLIEIVREVVPVTYWEEIVRRIESEEKKAPRHDVVDAEVEEGDDLDVDDDDSPLYEEEEGDDVY